MREMIEHWGRHRDERVSETGITKIWVDAEPGLTCVAAEQVTNVVAMTPAQMVGFAASTSFGAAYLRTLSPAQAAAYLGALEAEFEQNQRGRDHERRLRADRGAGPPARLIDPFQAAGLGSTLRHASRCLSTLAGLSALAFGLPRGRRDQPLCRSHHRR